MDVNYLEFHSENLDRPMPMSVYGYAGRPVLFSCMLTPPGPVYTFLICS